MTDSLSFDPSLYHFTKCLEPGEDTPSFPVSAPDHVFQGLFINTNEIPSILTCSIACFNVMFPCESTSDIILVFTLAVKQDNMYILEPTWQLE